MRAVILAGGRGTRLKPYTATLPKPLVPVGDRSILEIVLLQLKAAGVTRATMAVNHLAHLIMSYFGDGGRWGLEVDYSLENQPLSTIAPLRLIKDLPETFFIMNGDVLTDLNFRSLYEEHLASGAEITVSTFERDAEVDFGVLDADAEGRVVGFREKPVYHFTVSMGVYVLQRSLLDMVPRDRAYGFDDLMLDCIREKRNARVRAHRGFWLDIGRPADYEEANDRIREITDVLFPGGEPSVPSSNGE